MYRRAVSNLYQLRTATTKASKHVNNFGPAKHPTPELASLPPALHLRSLQRLRTKRGTIKPILNNERIEPGALVDPTHPAVILGAKAFHAPYNSNDYFNARAYPNAMLKRLGVTILPKGRLRPRPPPERDFPIFKHKKRAKLARVYIMPIKSTHKSAVVRVRLKRKLNEAIQLVVTRGADADPEGQKIIFNQSEALESKWLLRDWYYVFYPRVLAYHAPWPALIKAVREALAVIVQRGSEMSMDWNLDVATREAKAMGKLTRREMRRVRMWRRQDQEAVTSGGTAEDVGLRWKQKGMGAKKRRGPRQPGIGSRETKVPRAASRLAFQEDLPSPKSKVTAPQQEPISPKPGSIGVERGTEAIQSQIEASMRSPKVSRGQRSPQRTESQAIGSRSPPSTISTLKTAIAKPATTKPLTPSQPTSKPPIPRLSASSPPPVKPPTRPPGRVYIKPPSSSLLDAIRRKPAASQAAQSDSTSTNNSTSGRNQQTPTSSSGKRGS